MEAPWVRGTKVCPDSWSVNPDGSLAHIIVVKTLKILLLQTKKALRLSLHIDNGDGRSTNFFQMMILGFYGKIRLASLYIST